MVLVRYPKPGMNSNTVVEAAGTGDWDTGSQSDQFNNGRSVIVFESKCRLHIAPARYPNVRKVVFHAGIHAFSTNGGTNMNCRLAVMPSSTSSLTRALTTVNIPKGTIVGGTAAALPLASPAANSFVGYDHFGATRTIPGSAGAIPHADGDVAMLTVEFERFDADPEVQNFFNDWDAIAALGSDEYVAYGPMLDFAVPFASDLDVGGWGVTVVQAPSADNRATTCKHLYTGWVVDPAFENGAVLAPEGITRWTYHADEWDGLEEITLFGWGVPDQAGGGVEVTLREYLTAAAAGGSTIFTETFSGSNGTFEAMMRTQDFASLLVDGRTYGVQCRMTGALGATRRRPMWWLEIKQSQFTKTTTYHEASTTNRSNPKIPGGAPQLWAEAGLTGCFFDPLWYNGIPNSDITKRRIYFGQLRRNSAHTNRQAIRSDTTLNSVDDNDAGGALTGYRDSHNTAVNLSPDFKTALTGARDHHEAAILGNDPIDQVGSRKLYIGWQNPDVWQGVSNDQSGQVGIYYSYLVPDSEVSDLGPVFVLDAFNPEGCAATSAGLGDPGVLVITNGSTIPVKFDPVANVIEDNGVPVPFKNEVPTTSQQDVGGSPEGLGLIDGTYVYRYTFRNCCTGKESNPNPEDITVVVSGSSPVAQVTFNFNGVRIPGDPQICEICLYRTVIGGPFPVLAKVGCFDPNETSIFIDDLGDTNLDFINDSLSITNDPMPCVPYIAAFRNRIFGAGDIPQLSPSGTVAVVEGSDQVVGDDSVAWDRCLEGKYIQIAGDCRVYEIERVLPPLVGTSPAIARLCLTEDYEGSSGIGLQYIICGRPNRVYYSEPVEPECWPLVNFIDVEPGDGDRITGLASNFDRLVVTKRNKTYVLAFREIPALEVIVPGRVSSDVGGIGPRTFAQAEVGTIWLADRGLALYDGRGVAHVPESVEINDIFTDPNHRRYVRRNRNGIVPDAVGVFYPKREQYLLLLPTVQTTRGCNLMLVWDIKMRNITLLEFCQEFQSMVVGKDSSGDQRVYLGDTDGFVWVFDLGNTDGVGSPGSTGTVRGFMTGAGREDVSGASFIDDSTATFIEGGVLDGTGLSGTAGLSGSQAGSELGLAGACLFFRENSSSPWLSRKIFAATKTRIYVTPSFTVADRPSATWEYMLGPIDFLAQFKPFNYLVDDSLTRHWKEYVVHEVEEEASELRIELLPDFQNSDPDDGVIVNESGVAGNRVAKMDFKFGRQVLPVPRNIHAHMAVRLTNFAPEEPIRILNHVLGMEQRLSK